MEIEGPCPAADCNRLMTLNSTFYILQIFIQLIFLNLHIFKIIRKVYLFVIGDQVRAYWHRSWRVKHHRLRLRHNLIHQHRHPESCLRRLHPLPHHLLTLLLNPHKKMESDYGGYTQLRSEIISKEKRKRSLECKGTMRGNKGGYGMRGGGDTQRGRLGTSGPICHRIIILMMMILGKFRYKQHFILPSFWTDFFILFKELYIMY